MRVSNLAIGSLTEATVDHISKRVDYMYELCVD